MVKSNISGIRTIVLQAPEGGELDAFNSHMETIDKETSGRSRMISCSGFNARKEEATKLTDSIKEKLADFNRLHEKAKTNVAKPGEGGSCVYLPDLIIIQNYGWGIWGSKSSEIIESFN